jgi:DNA-binding GntR family transcriptional regulator
VATATAGYPGLALESSFEPVSSRRTFEEAVEQIAERIKAGDLHLGDRLPSERELAALMRISRPTLREAVKVLAEAGVLVVRRGQSGGIFVASELVPRDLLRSRQAIRVSEVAGVLGRAGCSSHAWHSSRRCTPARRTSRRWRL